MHAFRDDYKLCVSCLQLADFLADGMILGNVQMGTVQMILDPNRLSKLHHDPALELSHVLYSHVLLKLKSKTSIETVLKMLQCPGMTMKLLVSNHDVTYRIPLRIRTLASALAQACWNILHRVVCWSHILSSPHHVLPCRLNLVYQKEVCI